MRRTFIWIVVILAGLGWTAWSQFQHLWGQRNQLIADRIRNRLVEIAPDWEVQFAAAEMLDGAQVRLTDLAIGPRARGDVLVTLPELLVQLDSELLSKHLQVLITKAEARGAVVHVERDAAGRWNWEGLPSFAGGGLPGPDIACRDCTVQIHLHPTETLPEIAFALSNIDLTAACESFQAYQLRGASQVDTAGAVSFDGTLNLQTRAWSLAGRCAELQSPDRLLELAAGLSPEARQQLSLIARNSALPRTGNPVGNAAESTAVRAVTHSNSDGSAQQRCCLPAFGVSARLELAFDLRGGGSAAPVQYQLGARIRDGVIDNPAIPVPLHDLQGEVFLDNQQVIVRSFQAANGHSRIYADGHLRRDAVIPQRRFVVQAHNLQFGREIRDQLDGGLLRFYDAMRPAGRFNIDIAAETDATGNWKVQLKQFTAEDCSLLLSAFPYPTQNIGGRMWQEGNRFHVDFTGMAGTRPFVARGEFRDPGSQVKADIEVRVAGVPLDELLVGALSTVPLQPARHAAERLQLGGFADVAARVVKRGIPHESVKVAIDAQLRNATVNPQVFPYRVTGLQGRVYHNPLADDPALRNVWQFMDLTGTHGAAQLRGSGAFVAKGPNALLDLTFAATDVPIDRELEYACISSSPALRELFDSVHPVGRVNLDPIRVLWAPGAKPVITLPSISVTDAEVRLKYWPYTWERVSGQLAWERNRLTIAQMEGFYGGETRLRIDNQGVSDAAFLEIPPEGPLGWRLHLERVDIARLVPDSVFRRSLIPSGVAAIVETLDPRGPLDLNIGLDVRQAAGPDGLVTADWQLAAQLENNSFAPGLELSDVTGSVQITRGIWDGRQSFVDGHFQLETATALDFPLTNIQGPFLVNGDDVFVGTPVWPGVREAPPNDPAANPFAAKEVQADVYRGRVGCSLQAKLSARDPELSTYRAMIAVQDVRLEDWAADNGSTAEKLRGPINGQMDFIGQGTSDRTLRGQGYVMISPAQLYELPVLNRVLSSFDLRQPNRTAFNFAYGEFEIRDGLFDFKVIDLVGDALRLVGQGTVAYAEGLNQQLAIEFGRSNFRNQIPIFGQIFSAVTANSIGIRVGGTIEQPLVQVQPKLGIVDDTLRKMLDAFNNGQTPTRPIPVTGQSPRRN
jgi:hypothetical protein